MTREHDSRGLSSDQAARAYEKVGPNKLPESRMQGPLVLFVKQFLSPFIYMLVAAAVISLALSQYSSAVFIVAVLLLNAAIGTFQEYSAQKAAAALRSMVVGRATVIRDGRRQTIDVTKIVPGDLVELESGNKVPADLELTETDSLEVDESLLTGESTTVEKDHKSESDSNTPVAERADMCFAGTLVNRGRGRGIVTATANATELGKIAHEVQQSDVTRPPLMIRIEHFTYQAALAIAGAIVILVALMMVRGGYAPADMLLMAVGLAVSAIPEGLPAALTVALAVGMNAMAKKNVIIRKLVAVEALGSCTFICSDKTGTLTVNEMTARKIILPDGTEFETSGEGVGPGEVKGPDDEHARKNLRTLCMAGIYANEGELDYGGESWAAKGDVVDTAFLVLAKKAGFSISDSKQDKEQDTIPYESERAFSGAMIKHEDASYLYVKGSPERVLEMCTKVAGAQGEQDIDASKIEDQFTRMAKDGYRLIALARKKADHTKKADGQHQDMVFLGLVGMIDPLRPEAKDAIEKARKAKIEVAMITGDHPETARAISRQLGLIQDAGTVVTGPQLKECQTEQELRDLIRPARVFARIEPRQKQTIVETFMEDGHYVAVTGDGVNDAPAMRTANAGIAMGRRGTDVARETAELIITDDNFASIINGVEQGRVVYNNIRKVVAMLVATAFSAIVLFFSSTMAGLPMPMTAVQLLWMNLVAYGVQDVSLAFEPKEGDELTYPPRNPKEPIFERLLIEHVVVAGSIMGACAFGTYYMLLQWGYEVEQARNLVLMLMVLFGNIHTLNSRSETRSIFSIPLFSNKFLIIAVPMAQLIHIAATFTPGLSDVLELSPVAMKDWALLLCIAMVLLVVEEGHKALHRWRHRAGSED